MTNDPVRAVRRPTRAWRVHVLAGLVAATFAAGASAQVQRIDMGRSMDANPQIGTGGSNRPVQGYVPINGNDIISGNVSGLKAFHAPTGTTSTYEFRAPLGTSTLENFARQSATGANSVGSAYSESYYLPSTVKSGGGLSSSPMGGGFDSQYIPRSAANPATPVARSAGQLGNTTGAFDRLPQQTQLAPSSPGGLLSSPIFVMRDLASPEPSEGQRSTNVLNGETRTPASLNGFQPGETLANPQRATLTGDQVTPENPARKAQTDEIKNSAVGPRDKPGEEPQGVYRDLLSDLKKAEAEAKAQEENQFQQSASVGMNVVPGTRSPTPTAANTPPGQRAPGARPQGTNLITDADMIDPLTGMPRPGALLTNGRGRGATTRPARGTASALTPRSLEDLPDSTLGAGARVKPLISLVPPREGKPTTTVDVLLARAETLLKESKYMDAAATYEQALIAQPENALALVGKSHAEMGAGAYQSAAYDLKFVFTRNPQMVGVKYKMDTFISPTRQDFLVKDLTGLAAGNKEMADTASFLLSYLYYQTGKQQLLRSELQRWGDSASHDAWQSVVRRAWLPDAAPAQGGVTR